jgi:type 1 glutamine amidotransferase
MSRSIGKIICLIGLAVVCARAADRILIFTKTAAYREDNIAPTRLALKNFYTDKGLDVDTSENAALFSDTTLAKYQAIVFLKTSGDALNPAQQTAFEKWFHAGGGFQAIHSALDTEYDWPFYGKLIGGAWYKTLPGDQNTKQTIVIEDTADISTKGLPKRWERTDEIYGFKANPRAAKDPAMHILATVDESTFPKGVAGTDHPMSWYTSYNGGKAWTTAMGHVTAAYSDALFLGHLWGGMQYVLGRTVALNTDAAREARSGAIVRAWTGAGFRFGPGPGQDARGRTLQP